MRVCSKCKGVFKYGIGINLDIGYGSRFDGQRISFDLCDDCFEDILKTFEVAPFGLFKTSCSYRLSNEQHQKEFERWKESGEWDEMRYASYEDLCDYNGFYNTDYINKCIKKYYPDKPLLEEG